MGFAKAQPSGEPETDGAVKRCGPHGRDRHFVNDEMMCLAGKDSISSLT